MITIVPTFVYQSLETSDKPDQSGRSQQTCWPDLQAVPVLPQWFCSVTSASSVWGSSCDSEQLPGRHRWCIHHSVVRWPGLEHRLRPCWPCLAWTGGTRRWKKGMDQWIYGHSSCLQNNSAYKELTYWGRDNMAAMFQTTFLNAFTWMKMPEFRLRFHLNLFLRVQLTIFQHWFR